MRWHRSGTAGLREAVARAEARGAAGAEKVSPVVEEILRRVREEGDAALAEYTRRFDRFDPEKKGFAVPRRGIDAAWRRVPAALKRSLELAAERIEVFHRRQVEGGFGISLPGATIGQRVLPVARAGVYVPGGTAAYPSTPLITAPPLSCRGRSRPGGTRRGRLRGAGDGFAGAPPGGGARSRPAGSRPSTPRDPAGVPLPRRRIPDALPPGGGRGRQPACAGTSEHRHPGPVEGPFRDPQRGHGASGSLQPRGRGRLYRRDQPHPSDRRGGALFVPPRSCRFLQEN